MRRTQQLIAIATAIAAHGAPASADDMAGMVMASAPASTTGAGVTAGVSLLAAQFDSPFYEGNYQGVMPAVSYQHGRWAADAMLGMYRVDANGRTLYGAGDLMLEGSATILDAGPWRAGVTIAGMAPTGDMATGFGMGHVMVMPSAWGTRQLGIVALRASVGYARGLVALGEHDHGGGPIVAPMNLQEIDWAVSASLPVWRRFAIAVQGDGGVPVGVMGGVDRAIGALRLSWADTRMTTAVELQVGIAGDPFTVRGVVETGVVF